MPVFTSIGLALGSTVAASAAGIGAFGVGVAATGAAAALGAQQYSAAKSRTAAGKATGAAVAQEKADQSQAIAEAAALNSK